MTKDQADASGSRLDKEEPKWDGLGIKLTKKIWRKLAPKKAYMGLLMLRISELSRLMAKRAIESQRRCKGAMRLVGF
jgi:hypothetical protein